ncbi:hypothetical protein [Mycobacteroides abscessus]|uniref:hypothetical protein n=1 Tax=Mycobacteroides abscessus TaxID=36809 RepID=UPI000C26A5C5|nr:hypothetical protein [Mycobacteroides abscessus]RIR68507.1 hypothetical protein D2E62_05655 [Mycobacteroides abscessus]
MAVVGVLAFVFIIGATIYIMFVYGERSKTVKSWRPPNGGLGSGYPESLNPWLQAERAVPRPPWPIDEDGNPIEDDESKR